MAWLTFFFGLARRAARWTWLLLIVSIILLLGLGGPLAPIDHIFEFWGHW
ncbi:hypothetical protein GG804_00785 [Sphingomonas histidinilytica]|jgi:hypothetical protein|uniref:Uncharacterized protein n=1 Tax=Rhizorhabdus histidinilytica TaxID=439228 RepID=A0A1T5C0K0_9SPHN|nr:hypothetical protein [Rhizorhabdus histidinilytica]MBO9375292.1 hypothetical protein [Rhizorhabdus histidinilytica]SKB53148.1 hypothetical protein SAMN06295920_103486 [Rhizorhabdus histidinilytica]